MDYNSIATGFDNFKQQAVTDWVLGYAIVIKNLTPLTNKTILDFGCGTGEFSRYMCDKGAEKVIGLDISDKMLSIASNNRNNDNLIFHQINKLQLDFIADEVVDAITFNFVLSAFSSRECVHDILREAWRVVKPNGLVSVLNVNWEKSNGKEFVSFKLDHIECLYSGAEVSGTLKSDEDIKIRDFFWSKTDYYEILKDLRFKSITLMEPVADADVKWINEAKYPPFQIITAIK